MWRYSDYYYTILTLMVVSGAWSFLTFTNNNTIASIIGAVVSFILLLHLKKMNPKIKYIKEEKNDRTRR